METTPSKILAVCKAREVLDKFGVEEPEHIVVEDIAAALGAEVREGFLSGADGMLLVKGEFGAITVNSAIPEEGRKRFVIAHEIGHFLLHRPTGAGLACSGENFHSLSRKMPREAEANYFAAELLMPEEIFRKRVSGEDFSLRLLEALCEEYRTTLTATLIRFVMLRPEYALVCSSSQRICWFVRDSEGFPFLINARGKVHPDSVAVEFFKGDSVPEFFFPVSHEAWLEGRYPDGTLKEFALPLPQYRQVLSVLYVEED